MPWTEEDVIKLQQLMYQLSVESLDELIRTGDDEDSDSKRLDFLATDSVEDAIDSKFTKEALREFINQLRPRELRVITMRFGLDGTHPKTLQEVANVFGMTRERIRQVESKALQHLKRILEKNGIKSSDDI